MSYSCSKKPNYNLIVKKGSSGFGLFALEDIPKDKFVIEYCGTLLTDEESDKKGGSYLFEIDKNWTIDGSSRKNLARYINHSCRPNCEAEIDGKHVYIYAKRNIKAGEELSYNYGKGFFKDYIEPNGCRCVKCK